MKFPGQNTARTRPEHGQARRLHDVLRDHIKCLALYPLDQPMGRAGAEAFILNDKFNHGRRHEHMTLEDVDDAPRSAPNKYTGILESKPSQIQQLVMTISKRLNGKTGFRATAIPCTTCSPAPACRAPVRVV